jgi:hypothetical protein
MGAEDYPMVEFGSYCQRKLLVTGFVGDVVWAPYAEPTSTMARKDASGSTLGEFRLRHGFVHVPGPFIGATQHDVLLRIAKAPEMQSHRIGGHYDRPIPRRIAEEQGVPRGSFATAKKATTIILHFASLNWSRHSLEDLTRFERRTLRERGIALPYYIGWAARTAQQGCGILARRAAKRLGFHRLEDRIGRVTYNHPRHGNMAFLWALDKIKVRYPKEQSGGPKEARQHIPD